ncbi:MAG: GerMN domain-containing protein [Treponema sp.]|nr:GerMN domain-containing protein [Treponema sp.]
MAKKEKKTNQTGLALACWILGFLILLIVFLVKQDEIYSNLKTTRFFERIFGSTPEFIANHKVKEEPKEEEETIITLKTEEPVKTPAQNVVSSEPVYVPKEEPKVQPKTEDKEASSKAETQAQTKPQETTKTETKVEQPKPITKTVVNQKLYFVYIGEDGVVSRKVITREVEKNDSPLVTNINLLLKGPNSAEEGKGYKTLIPPGTKLISAYVRDGVAFLNFNEEFEFNRIGVDGYLAQLMQIVYTATEFSTVKSVQFLIDGQKKEYLGSEGVWIGSPLSRTSF